MTITELSHLRITPPSTLPYLSSSLTHAMTLIRTTTSHTFHLLSSSPNDLFILGSWDSVHAHEQFIASAENQALLKLLGWSLLACPLFLTKVNI
jgi:hypothetical protein